jgi:F0F1-type ATP synthase epsilon subunit
MEEQFFNFQIISPTITETLSVEWIEVESPTGSFLIGPGHSPLVSIIKTKSRLTYKRAYAEPSFIDGAKGIIKVSDNKAIALLD